MSYSSEIKKLGGWIQRETKIREVTYNKMPSTMSNGISARIIYLGDESVDGIAKKSGFMTINLVLRLSGEADNWADIIDTMQNLQNNLIRERDYDVKFGEVENPDGSNDEGGDFNLDLPLQIRVSTGRVAL